MRDLYEAKKGIGRVPAPILEKAPRFKELAARYLKTATHLAESTRQDRELQLGEDSQLVAYVGEILGHADGGITASKHYAKWVPSGYVASPALSDGELVVDLIERIAKWPQSDPTSASTVKKDVLESA